MKRRRKASPRLTLLPERVGRVLWMISLRYDFSIMTARSRSLSHSGAVPIKARKENRNGLLRKE
jgi:hypothetical protein